MYKAVFIDIDGTLIKSDHSISPRTIHVIKRLKENKILIVLVSARPLHGIIPIVEETGLAGFPVASLNGACISIDGTIIFESKIDVAVTEKIHEYVQIFDTTVIYYEQAKWFAELKNFHTDFEQRITSTPLIVESFDRILQGWKKENSSPNKILIISNESMITEIQNNLRRLYNDRLNIQTSKPTYLEIVDCKASKLTALKFIIDRYNIKQEDTIAIGDNFNDKEMIAFAGMGIAMENAPDEVKNAADYLTDTNDNDGVSKALTRFIDLLSIR
jgi:Cof subfamily protein (haloacid dehalogenase superfamily)